ncbi:MAG: DUF7024 domain-containing protein [Roseiflexaceae bacterium]
MSLRHIFKTEIRYWLPMTFISYLIINGYMSNWTSWLVPDVSVPFRVYGDARSYGVLFQRQVEGFWFFENTRYGYPFVATLYDFPMSFLDALTVKLIGQFWPEWYAIYTLYVVLSFVANAVVSYVVMRALGLSALWAIVGATLFNFVPFHFYRIGHVVFTNYTCIPWTFYIAWQIWQGRAAQFWQRPHVLASMLLGFVMGGYNIYYAIFSVIMLGMTTLVVAWRDHAWRVLWHGGGMVTSIMLGIMSGLIVPLINSIIDPNTIPLSRPVEDSVRYALWPVALFQLISDMRLQSSLNNVMYGISWNEYHANSVVGSLGIVLVLWGLLRAWLRHTVSPLMRLLGFELSVLVLYAAVGGGGLVVSLLLTSIIRGTNRFAIYAIFIGIVAVVWAVQQWLARRQGAQRVATVVAVGLLVVGGVSDSPVIAEMIWYPTKTNRNVSWERDVDFFRAVEARAGANAAVYQLPALAFPENDPNYAQTQCALYTRLFCSHGNGFGRDGAIFYHMLARAPVSTQLTVLSRLGFTGLLIDRSYRNMPAVEASFRAVLGSEPALEDFTDTIAYYDLPPPAGPVRPGRSTAEVIAAAQFLQDEYALRRNTDVTTPIDLRKPWLPGNVKVITGIYGLGVDGRWSDASDFRQVVVVMNQPLPAAFTLRITALAWERNINAPVTVVVGDQRRSVQFGATMTVQDARFTTDGTATTITIMPAYRQQASPQDARFIALLIQQLEILPR